MARFAAAAAALALAACANVPRNESAGFVCPARGGPPWYEVTTASFTVATDLNPNEAHGLARELERVRAAVLEGLFPGVPLTIPTRVRVVAFAEEGQFEEFAPEGLRAYLTRDGLGNDVVVLPRTVGRDQRLVLAHELAHHVARHVYPRQPRWFGEGLAGLAEGLAEPGAEFGRLPSHRRLGFLAERVTVRDLLAWDGRAHDGRWHNGSAVLVNYLVQREPERLDEFRSLLAAAEAPALAWRTVFPEWDPSVANGPEALDALLLEHARAHTRPGRVVAPDIGEVEKVARLLRPAEVHSVRLALPLHARGRTVAAAQAALRAEAEEALDEDAAHTIALQVLAALDKLDPLPLARRAVEAHPDDVRAWLWLGAAQQGRVPDEERLETFRRAVEIAPASAMAANNLAWGLLQAGNAADALPHAERAIRLAPGDPMALDTYAGVLEARGACQEALGAADRALELVPEWATEAQRAPWVERVARLTRTCGGAAGAATGAGESSRFAPRPTAARSGRAAAASPQAHPPRAPRAASGGPPAVH
jgi:tetratricopeptide (TPR) repeat protein